MITAIIFDFDGIILESAEIKTDAFKELFSEYPEKIQEIIDYHLLNAGISRYVKFKNIYEHILGKELSKEKETKLAQRFSQISLEKVLNASFVSGAREFLDKNKGRYQFFIASGTPESELRNIVHLRQLGGYFKEVRGSPAEKADIINQIMKTYHFTAEEVVYVGDSCSDRIAAEKARIVFIEKGKNPYAESGNQSWVIRDLFELEEILEKIENLNFKEGN